MDINKIKFTPKANAFADVYSKATGIPFVGELVAAAAGNGGEPTPTTDYIVLAPPTVIDEWYDTNPKLECSGGSCGVNMLFLSDLQRTTVSGACTVGSVTDTTSPMAINHISGTGTEYDGMYSLDFVFAFDGLTAGNHNFSVVITADGETFNISGSFTVPEEPVQFTFTSIKVIDDYTLEATSNIPAPVDNTRVYLEDSLSQWGGSISPIENGSTQWVMNPAYEYFFNEGSIPTEGGECSAWGEFIEGDDNTIYGLNWTYQNPQI